MAPNNSVVSSSRTSRSKQLYERYDVELPAPPSSNKTRKKWRDIWFNSDKEKEQEQLQRQQLPPDQWTNIEMMRYIFKNSSFKSKLIAILIIMILSSIIKSALSLFHNDAAKNDDLKPKRGPVMTKYGLRPENMDPDSHARSNPFAADPDHVSYMEGILEIKKKKKRDDEPSPISEQNQQPVQNQQQQEESLQLEDKPTQMQGEKSPQQARNQAARKRGKGRKMPSG